MEYSTHIQKLDRFPDMRFHDQELNQHCKEFHLKVVSFTLQELDVPDPFNESAKALYRVCLMEPAGGRLGR